MENIISKKWYLIGITILFISAAFFSFYKLSESPQTWTDEGLIIQTSQNMVGQGVYGFQTAPSHIISPSFISTSYPVTFPVALSFYLFGIGLFQARIVMALFILALLGSICLYIGFNRRGWAFATLAILTTFPPLYGQGKNVLGEVPGLFFAVLSAYFLEKLSLGSNKKINVILFGLFAGLSLATKPIFVVLIPGFLMVIFILIKKEKIQFSDLFFIGAAVLIPVFLWMDFQFLSSDSISSVVGYYSNPHSLNLFQAISVNVIDFFTHGHTLFTGFTFALWTAVFIKLLIKKEVKVSEIFLYVFSIFIFINYFRNPPYYRYFFVAEVLSLAFLFRNLQVLMSGWKKGKIFIYAFLFFLIAFQLYGVIKNSWVASTYNSHRSQVMNENIGALNPILPVFVYQAPEAVVFLKHYNYYQYFSGTITTEFGEENLNMLRGGENLLVLTKKDLVPKFSELFNKYHEISHFDRYVILSR